MKSLVFFKDWSGGIGGIIVDNYNLDPPVRYRQIFNTCHYLLYRFFFVETGDYDREFFHKVFDILEVMSPILTEKQTFGKNFFSLFMLCLVALSSLTVCFLTPKEIGGDGLDYVKAIEVIQTGNIPQDFVPNRILTTFLPLYIVIFLGSIVGSIQIAWLSLNILFYFILCIFFYKILDLLFQNSKISFIGGLFFASNYGILIFSLNYLMDVGGWAFYVMSLYFFLLYIQKSEEEGKRKMLHIALGLAGAGVLFKEYAFLAFIPIGLYYLYEQKSLWKAIGGLWKGVLASFIPIILVYIYVFNRFNYTYVNWLSSNQNEYIYSSRIIEYIKSFGSLYTVLALLFLGGLYSLYRYKKEQANEESNNIFFYVCSVCASALVVFIWPAITQRILSISVPAVVLSSAFLFERFKKYWYIFLIALVPYILLTFFMDSFILSFVNLPL